MWSYSAGLDARWDQYGVYLGHILEYGPTWDPSGFADRVAGTRALSSVVESSDIRTSIILWCRKLRRMFCHSQHLCLS